MQTMLPIRSNTALKSAKSRLRLLRSRLIDQESILQNSGLSTIEIQKATAALAQEIDEIKQQIAAFEDSKSGVCPQTRPLSHLGQILIQLRLAAGVTQKELARRLGVTNGVISRDEGKMYAGISIERANAILEALGAEIDLIARLGNQPPAQKEKTADPLPEAKKAPEPSTKLFEVILSLQISSKSPMTATKEPRKSREDIENELLARFDMQVLERKEKFAGASGSYKLSITASGDEEKSAILEQLANDCEQVAARLKCKASCSFGANS